MLTVSTKDDRFAQLEERVRRLEMAVRSEAPDTTQFGRMLLRLEMMPNEFLSFAKEANRAVWDPASPEDVLAVWRRHFPDRQVEAMLMLGMARYAEGPDVIGLAMMEAAIPEMRRHR